MHRIALTSAVIVRTLAKHAFSLLTLSPIGCGVEPRREGPTVEIQTSPLTLAGVEDVCYGLTVQNGDPAGTPDTVWTRSGICSLDYGNAGGGDITYIGSCDADPNGRMNYVSLVLESLTVATNTLLQDQTTAPTGTQPDFRNPCPADDPCVLPFPCRENEDAEVLFDLTVLRRAHQGFFDIAVNFDDIFCSVKVDCSYDDAGDDPIELLFDATGRRAQSAVLGFACTRGPGAEGTVLHMNGPHVVCDGVAGRAPPAPIVFTCTTEGAFYGLVFGATDTMPQTVLPVRWHDVGGVRTAETLPLDEYLAGLVTLRLDEDHLAGRVAELASDPGDPVIWSLAVWARDGSGWELASTHSQPPTHGGLGLEAEHYDDTTGRLWGRVGGASGDVGAFWQRSGPGWDFDEARPLPTPTGFERCLPSSVEGNVVAGQCYTPSNENATIVWDLADINAITATILVPPLALFDALTTLDSSEGGPGSVLSDGSVLAWASGAGGSGGQHIAVHWTWGGAGWTATSLGAPMSNTNVAWEQDDVIALLTDFSQYELRRRIAGSWETWSNFALPGHTISELRPNGYLQPVAAVFGSVRVDGAATWVPFIAPLPDPSDPIVLQLLPTSGVSFANSHYLEVASTATAVRLLGAGYDESAVFRTFVWELALGNGILSVSRWLEPEVRRDFHDFSGIVTRNGEEIEAAHMSSAPSCTDIVGTDPHPDASRNDGAPSRWTFSPSAAGEAVPPLYYPLPEELLPAVAGGPPRNFSLDPTVTGNAWNPPHAGEAVWQYAVYHGVEGLQCNGLPCQKVYWNTAIGFDPTAPGCRLLAEATASQAPGLELGWIPDAAIYPLIEIDIALTSSAGSGPVEVLCRQNPLDGPDSGAITRYTDPNQRYRFCHVFDGTSPPSTWTGCTWPTTVVPEACEDGPGVPTFGDAFERDDGPLGDAFVAIPSMPAAAITSGRACHDDHGVGVVQIMEPSSQVEVSYDFIGPTPVDNLETVAVAANLCAGDAIVAGLDAGGSLQITDMGTGASIHSDPITFFGDTHYHLVATFSITGDVTVTVTTLDDGAIVGTLSANLGQSYSYRQAGFVVGRVEDGLLTCVDNLTIESN